MVPLEYYAQAGKWIAERAPNPVFCVFSNDPEWARERLTLPGETILAADHTGGTPIEDYHLMGACRHFIIANSTFSWWPAWLADHPEKHVVAPAHWFERDDWRAPGLQLPEWKLL
jgi:hypothetical protein